MGMLRHGTCLGSRRRFDDLCDAELTPKVEGRVRRHVAVCRRCRNRLAGVQATIHAVAVLGTGSVPMIGSVRDQVAADITAQSNPTAPGPMSRPPRS